MTVNPTWRDGRVTSWLTTVDHKRIGILYIVTAFFFFFAAGVMALLMRAQLAQADNDFITQNSYNQLFTIHGTAMVFLFVVPILAGFGNYLVPLMIGAKDMAFPRLNALSYWLFLLGGLIRVQPRIGAGPLDPRPSSDLALVARGRDQLHRHDPQHAHAGDDVDAHPALRLVDRGLRRAARARPAGHLGCRDDAPPRPPGSEDERTRPASSSRSTRRGRRSCGWR